MEDNEGILFNLQILLEQNGYQVSTAINGREALDLLDSFEEPPDLVLSDIMMPQVNGYDFYQEFIKNEAWYQTPFIFLTAKTSPEDIRFGKMLGVDDYILKPFDQEDLLATIIGKIRRKKRGDMLQAKLTESNDFDTGNAYSPGPQTSKSTTTPNITVSGEPGTKTQKTEKILIMVVYWDDLRGPVLEHVYPPHLKTSFNLEHLAGQLYDSSIGIYGQNEFTQPEDILLRIPKIDMSGFVYFDSFKSQEFRGGAQNFMLAIIAPRIHYLEATYMRQVLDRVADQVKGKRNLDLDEAWKDLQKFLSGQ